MDEEIWGGIWFTIAVLTLPIGLLTALFINLQIAFEVFIIGWLLLLPLIILFKELLGALSTQIGSEKENSTNDSDDPLGRLKNQYAEGEIDENEFEREVDNSIGEEHSTLENTGENAEYDQGLEKEHEFN